MIKTRKSIIAVLLAIFLMAGLIACNRGDDGGSQATPTAGAGSQTSSDGGGAAQTPDSTPAGPREIDWAATTLEVHSYAKFSDYPWLEMYALALDKFIADHPGVTVINSAAGGLYGYDAILAAAVASGNPWDLQYSCYPYMIPGFYGGTYQALDDYLEGFDFYDQNKAFMGNFMFQNQYFGIANAGMQELYIMTYNPKTFTDNGLKTPKQYFLEGNWTFDAVYELAVGLAPLDLCIYGNVGQTINKGGGEEHGASYVRLNNDGTLSVDYNNQGTIDYLNFVERLGTEYRSIYAQYEAVPGSGEMLELGYAQGYVITGDIVTNIPPRADLYANGELEFVPFPTADGKPITVSNSWCFAVPKGSKNIEAAMILGQYLSEGASEYQESAMNAMLGAEIEYYNDCIKDPVNQTPYFMDVDSPLINAWMPILIEGEPVSTFLTRTTETLNAQVEMFNENYGLRWSQGR